jgi:hypothetical protein
MDTNRRVGNKTAGFSFSGITSHWVKSQIKLLITSQNQAKNHFS